MEQRNEKHSGYENKIITIPNILSFFRICLIPVIVWLYTSEHDYVWAGYVLILSEVTDLLDGFIARHFNMISNLGKVLDPIADKLTQGVMLICLVLRFPLMIAPLILMLIKEIYMGVSGILIIRRNGIVSGADWHGKAATFLLDMTMVLHIFWLEITPTVSAALIIACSVMIIVSFVFYWMRNRDLLKKDGK